MKKLLALLLAFVMVLSMAACAEKPEEPKPDVPNAIGNGSDAPEAEGAGGPEVDMSIVPATVKLTDSRALEGKKIGCTIIYKGDEWCAAVTTALETLGKYYGADITVEDGDQNDETQTKQIENMIANNCDIIFADPSPDGVNEALMKAVDADIPIIIFDGYWTMGDEHALSTITWDQKATGTLIGEYFVDYVKKNMDGKCRVVELTNAISTHCQERFVGLHEIIDAANADGCEIEIVSKNDTQGNRELAYNAVAAVVEPYDFIISDVDNGAQGAVSALQAAGNTDVKVLSMGAYGSEPFNELHEEDPNYLACLNVDAWVLAEFVIGAAMDYFDGKEVPKRTNIDLYVVDSTNVTDFWSFD